MKPTKLYTAFCKISASALLCAALGNSGYAEPTVIVQIDPSTTLTKQLWDGTSTRDFETSGGLRFTQKQAYAQVAGEGSVQLQQAFKPNQFPYVRARFNGRINNCLAVALPGSPENARNLQPVQEVNMGEWQCRLPPDRILTPEAYSGEGLRLEFTGRTDGGWSYLMVDAVPTLGLTEYPRSLNYARWTDLALSASNWNVFEISLAGPPGEATLLWENAEGLTGEFSFTIPDEDAHTYRIVLMKSPDWTGTITRLALTRADQNETSITSARLRFFPEPGAGCISTGITVLGKRPAAWKQLAERITNWRFVAGQSIGPGNTTRFAKTLGKVFEENSIRWETDMPTWLFCDESRLKLPVDSQGKISVEETAMKGFLEINAPAEVLKEYNIPLRAVHFDGLIRRLLMPSGSSQNGWLTSGGYYEVADGDFEIAYELAARTVCEFLALTRTHPNSLLKETEFWVQPNFHVWPWQHGSIKVGNISTRHPDIGNFREFMEVLIEMDRTYEAEGKYEGPTPLAGFGADWVFMNVRSQARKLVSYEWFTTEENGYRFNVVNNGTIKGKTPEQRSSESIEYLEQFLDEGGRPSAFVPYYWQTTWRSAPPSGKNGEGVLPITDPHSFTATVLASARLTLREGSEDADVEE